MIDKFVAVTGHTRGIGRGIFDHYFPKSPLPLLGFSRTNGYDISQPGVVDRIIRETELCDIFFNNAYHHDCQSRIAAQWFESHRDQQHLLVNISSIAPVTDRYLDPKNRFEKYSRSKTQLDEISWNINFANSRAKCINVSPGLVDTDMAHPAYAGLFRANATMIPVDDIVQMITDLVDGYFNKKWFVPHIYLVNNDKF
jgi:NAD(P)-dependent dehydrogenase (short-subunit alcohol dehydrogenase family)